MVMARVHAQEVFFQAASGEKLALQVDEVMDSCLCAIASSGTSGIGLRTWLYQIAHDAMRLDTSIFWCEDRK